MPNNTKPLRIVIELNENMEIVEHLSGGCPAKVADDVAGHLILLASRIRNSMRPAAQAKSLTNSD